MSGIINSICFAIILVPIILRVIRNKEPKILAKKEYYIVGIVLANILINKVPFYIFSAIVCFFCIRKLNKYSKLS